MTAFQLYDNLLIKKELFLKIKEELTKELNGCNYILYEDVTFVKNLIHELYPGFDMDKVDKIDFQEMRILCYRILLTEDQYKC